jgi:isopentenyl-diphosphate delta-isomerase
MENIILVDESDNEIGAEEKLKVHKEGKLHRAFSVLIFKDYKSNEKQEMLIHKRAVSKYHCPGLWTNACCSHPAPGENILDAAKRRLKEEMGIDCDEYNISLKEIFAFKYKIKFENGLTEHEFDHVLVGYLDKSEEEGEKDININPDKNEVEEYRWMSIDELKKDIQTNPKDYTFWFKEIMKRLTMNEP